MKLDRLNKIRGLGFQTANYVGIRKDDKVDIDLIKDLLKNSLDNSVNIRTYTDDMKSKGNPFVYGLRDLESILRGIIDLREQGYNLILNETIDVNDGGVSGVLLNGVAEFAPFSTPRSVENDAVCRLPSLVAVKMLSDVYSLEGRTLEDIEKLESMSREGKRIEFSIHPNEVGYLVWDIEDMESNKKLDLRLLNQCIMVPKNNKFSEMLGGKTFNLLLLNSMSIDIPKTTVVSKFLPPFTFGNKGNRNVWTRTSPKYKLPGKYITEKGYISPSELLSEENPTVLYQREIDVLYSGSALYKGENAPLVVEGVRGFGTKFMVGNVPPEKLPFEVMDKVRETVKSLKSTFDKHGICNPTFTVEWGYSKYEEVEIFQLNFTEDTGRGHMIVRPSSSVKNYKEYHTSEGLDNFRDFLQSISEYEGVKLIGNVGITSHFCDILREEKIPSFLVRG